MTLPQGPQVEITKESVLSGVDGNNCWLNLTLKGETGMTVIPTDGTNLETRITLTEIPQRTYTFTQIPGAYNAFIIKVKAKKKDWELIRKWYE